MSRHRYVRNLDLDEEMASDSPEYDDIDVPESYPGITETQRAQMNSGLDAVRGILDASYATDREIREALWDSYFDVDGTVQWFLQRRTEQVEKEKKAEDKRQGEIHILYIRPFPSDFFSLISGCSQWRAFGSPSSRPVPEDTPDLSHLSALQRLSLQSKAKKPGMGKSSLASLARKPAKSAPADTPATPGKLSLAAIAAKRRLATVNAPEAQVAPSGANPQLPATSVARPKTSKLAQKVKLANATLRTTSSPTSTAIPVSPSSMDVDVAAIGGSKAAITDSSDGSQRINSIPFDVGVMAAASAFGSIIVSDMNKTGPTSATAIAIRSHNTGFLFDTPSPDDIVEAKRIGTRLGKVARERGGP
ncbi:hypothetical protein DL93DRAFT_2129917 [Clavulina sp. PMI_390]|nr:hypothetical protein DL93DRAFT_2129917 [Clavulina sp. PMI_390]